MTDKIAQFPTAEASDRIIDRQFAQHGPGGVQGKPGDICVFCLDADADTWTIWPVVSVDSRGTVLACRAKNGETLSLWKLCALDVFFCNPVEPFDPDKLSGLLWREFNGLAGVLQAGREAMA